MKKPLLVVNIIALGFLAIYLVSKNSYLFQSSDKIDASYIIGNDVASNMLRQGIEINESAFLQGFKDGMKKTSEMDASEKKSALEWAQNQARKKTAETNDLRQQLLQKEMSSMQANQSYPLQQPRGSRPQDGQLQQNPPANYPRPNYPGGNFPTGMRPPRFDPRYPMGMKPEFPPNYQNRAGKMAGKPPYDNRVKKNSTNSHPSKESQGNN